MTKISKIMVGLGLLFISLICLLLIGEIAYRLYHRFFRGIPFFMSVNMFYDTELGWKGKKVFGNPAGGKYKIFIIGDSITDGCGVAEKNMYYSVIAEKLDAEIFAYGGCGYGTLQEYMVIDRYFDEIAPDLVILQTCANDFINNFWELEAASLLNNNLMVRPYLINGNIEYRYPRFPGKFRIFLSSHSRLFYSLANRIDRLLARLAEKGFLQSVEKDIEEKRMRFDKFRKAVEVTDDLIGKIKAKVGKTPIAAFSIGERELFSMISRKNDIEYLGDMKEKIEQEEAVVSKMRLSDGYHWDERGNRLCGDTLVQELQKRGYGKKEETH